MNVPLVILCWFAFAFCTFGAVVQFRDRNIHLGFLQVVLAAFNAFLAIFNMTR